MLPLKELLRRFGIDWIFLLRQNKEEVSALSQTVFVFNQFRRM